MESEVSTSIEGEQPILPSPPPLNMEEIRQQLNSINFHINTEDLPYEEDLQRNPSSLRSWLRYIDQKSTSPAVERLFLYERALQELPSSYKLWMDYLAFRTWLTDPFGQRRPIDVLVGLYERAIFFLTKMPRLWLNYLEFIVQNRRWTLFRPIFNRALNNLPVSQHDRLWEFYLSSVQKHAFMELNINLLRRYIQLKPDFTESFIELLITAGKTHEAIYRLDKLLRVEEPSVESSVSGPKAWGLMQKLVTLLPESAKKKSTTDTFGKKDQAYMKSTQEVKEIINYALERFPSQAGLLYIAFANYHLLKGDTEMAREIYENAIREKIASVKHFSQLFDAYAQMEESIVKAQLKNLNKKKRKHPPKDCLAKSTEHCSLCQAMQSLSSQVDQRLARLEELIEERPNLLVNVQIRQSPNNVSLWKEKISYQPDGPKKQEMYMEAVMRIDPKKAAGESLSNIWISFATYMDQQETFEASEQTKEETVKEIYEKAVQVPFPHVADLAAIWISYAKWIEAKSKGTHEKGVDDPSYAIQGKLDALTRLAGVVKPSKDIQQTLSSSSSTSSTTNSIEKIDFFDESQSVQLRLIKSVALWTHILQLEEAIGSVPRVKSTYERIIQLKIATPPLMFSYANFLEKNSFYEESFRVYERSIDLFGWPAAADFYNTYFPKLIDRFGSTKIERIRSTFEQALESVPPNYALPIYIYYGYFEEKYGQSTRKSLQIYHRAVLKGNLSELDKQRILDIYLSKSIQFKGILSGREVYSLALEILTSKSLLYDIALRFAAFERKLGEIDRARVLFAHGSQFTSSANDSLWTIWQEFEVATGDETSFREMLRIKRSVIASYPTTASLSSFVKAGVAVSLSNTTGPISTNPFQQLESLQAESEIRID